MYRKIIGGIISVVIITIMGIGKLDFIKQDNSVEEMEVSKAEQTEEINEDENENTTQDNPENEVEEIIKDEVTIPEKNENSIKAENTIATKSNDTQTSKKQETKEKQEDVYTVIIKANKEIKNKSVAIATIVFMLGNSSCVFADNNINKDEIVYSILDEISYATICSQYKSLMISSEHLSFISSIARIGTDGFIDK